MNSPVQNNTTPNRHLNGGKMEGNAPTFTNQTEVARGPIKPEGSAPNKEEQQSCSSPRPTEPTQGHREELHTRMAEDAALVSPTPLKDPGDAPASLSPQDTLALARMYHASRRSRHKSHRTALIAPRQILLPPPLISLSSWGSAEGAKDEENATVDIEVGGSTGVGSLESNEEAPSEAERNEDTGREAKRRKGE